MGRQRLTAKRSFLRTKETHSADLSVQKPGKKAYSPHSHKIFKGEYGDAVIYGRAMSYRGVLQEMPADFWQRVTVLRGEFRVASQRQRAAGRSGSGWSENQKKVRIAKVIHGDPAANSYFSTELAVSSFVDTFLEAIGDSDFPKRSQARARFLSESIAGYGEVSARRCRDICSDMRNEEKQRKHAQPELWIKCCGKARWTVNSVCPQCGSSPISIPMAHFI
ncbi:MAG: hypothetical protein C5B58_14400 [Acidobacteria bacterium]|nr:MAG: hypothetical protein C5B58_14400 [Acidobacteriota bacterium]